MLLDKENLDFFLRSRGVCEEDLYMKEEGIPSTLLMEGAQDFIDKVVDDLKNQRRITVVGDYDADGVCGTTVALRSLKIAADALGVKPFINYIIPHRFKDGYGITPNVIDRLIRQNPKTGVIITVDNGTVANEAVSYAKMKGLNVYITDHHQGLANAPEADVLVNPNAVGDGYPFKGICGTTVVFKLFFEMARQYFPDKLKDIEALIDFVGIATVADMMPVLKENRYYINQTIQIFNGESDIPLRFAWMAMIEYLVRINKMNRDQIITEMDFGFTFGPILNAQSRVEGSADIAVDLFESQNTSDIREKVEYMVSINERRKQQSNECFDRIDKNAYDDRFAIVIRDDSVGEGYIGLVAGKITEYFRRPAVVFTKSKEGLKGSARSIEGVDLLALLRQIDPSIYVKLGGHAAAAGMTIHPDRLDDFVAELNRAAQPFIDLDETYQSEFDFIVNNIDKDDIESIERLSPYGVAFERPTVKIESLPIKNIMSVGKAKQHVKVETENIDILVWNIEDELLNKIKSSESISIVGSPRLNYFRGEESIQIVAKEQDIELA